MKDAMQTIGTTQMDDDIVDQQRDKNSEIRLAFHDQTVFLTGGSGFLGKVLLERLLRTCPTVRRILVLLRPKKGKSVHERLQQILSYPVFAQLSANGDGTYRNKIQVVNGDCQLKNLGLSPQDYNLIKDQATIVIHAAATVRFDRPLKEAAEINVRAVQYVVQLCKDMANLKALIYVSTAFSKCIQPHIDEQFGPAPITGTKLMQLIDAIEDEQTLEQITPHLLGKYPNTYIYSKAIAEDIIATEASGLPVAIVRPGIVTSTYESPTPGWIDNFYGPIGITAAASLGVLRSMNADPSTTVRAVPVDYVANIVMAATWHVTKKSQHIRQQIVPIFNFVGSDSNTITWGDYTKYMETIGWDYPTEHIVWYYFFKLRKNAIWNKIVIFFLHTVVAYIVDFAFLLMNKPAIAVDSYRRIDKMMAVTSYFALRSWNFSTKNTMELWESMTQDDKVDYNFNMDTFDWAKYTRDCIIGGRIYLLKDPLETLPKGRRKLRQVMIAHYTLLAFLLFVFYKVVTRFMF